MNAINNAIAISSKNHDYEKNIDKSTRILSVERCAKDMKTNVESSETDNQREMFTSTNNKKIYLFTITSQLQNSML